MLVIAGGGVRSIAVVFFFSSLFVFQVSLGSPVVYIPAFFSHGYWSPSRLFVSVYHWRLRPLDVHVFFIGDRICWFYSTVAVRCVHCSIVGVGVHLGL